jgi:aminoglycoside phosphotransferase (APT) family kinase protein
MLRGSVVLQPENNRRWLDGLAQAAVQIHRVDATGFAWTYHRYNEHETLAVPRWSKKPEVWKKVIEIVDGPSPPYRECFVHRDYHPSNVLWYDGTVSGVVDWVNGCRGPAGIDVAWCRHNLANLHGVSLADEFLSAYIAAAGPEFRYNPYWDLMSVVELLPGPPTMYVGWRASGLPDIGDALMRQRVDLYAESVVARL